MEKNRFKINSNNLEDTDKIAQKLSELLRENGGLVCMYGDIGAGKTALTTLCAKYLNVKERVTSPSFVILNEYHSGDRDIYHFDLYRLEHEGLKSILDELQTYSQDKKSITLKVKLINEKATMTSDEINEKINKILKVLY